MCTRRLVEASSVFIYGHESDSLSNAQPSGVF